MEYLGSSRMSSLSTDSCHRVLVFMPPLSPVPGPETARSAHRQWGPLTVGRKQFTRIAWRQHAWRASRCGSPGTDRMQPRPKPFLASDDNNLTARRPPDKVFAASDRATAGRPLTTSADPCPPQMDLWFITARGARLHPLPSWVGGGGIVSRGEDRSHFPVSRPLRPHKRF